MSYGMTAINGYVLVVDGQPATGIRPHSVAYGASCSLRAWVSLRLDAPQADVLTLHIHVRRSDNSVAFSEDHSVSLDPGDGAEVPDIGTFIADRSGNWIVNLSLDSLNEGTQVATTGDIVFLNVSGGGNGGGGGNLAPLIAFGVLGLIIVVATRKRRS